MGQLPFGNPYDDLHAAIVARGLDCRAPQDRTYVDSIEDVGRIVRQERLSRRLKQGDVAMLARVGRRFVSELEAGKPSIQAAQLFRVLSVLEIEMALSSPKS